MIVLKIDEKCIRCRICLPYCPVGAITADKEKTYIDQDLCVECGVCHRAKICPVNAIYQQDLTWPRTLRAQFSNPAAYRHPTAIGGRGTDEMKTNDVTSRFKHGEAGFCIELGRPGIGATFNDAEKVTMTLAAIGVEFEQENPLTFLVNISDGKLKDEAIRNERVLSCIVECKASEERAVEVLKALQEASKMVNTVFSVGVISRCREGEIPIKPILDKAGIKTYINGKTNLGLGRVRGVKA